jgi:hypothetical protein
MVSLLFLQCPSSWRGELKGECGRSGHAVDENDVAVDVDDGNRDGYVLFHRLGLDAVSDFLRGDE